MGYVRISDVTGPLSAEELATPLGPWSPGICQCGPGGRGPSLFVEYFCSWHAALRVTREGEGTKRPMVVACGFAPAEILHL